MYGTLTAAGGVTGNNQLVGSLDGPNHIAVDPANGRIFYTNSASEDIYAIDIGDGSPVSTVITTGAMVNFEVIAYSENADMIYGVMNEEVKGIMAIPANNNDSGGDVSLDLDGRSNEKFLGVAVDDGSEVVYFTSDDSYGLYSTDFGGVSATFEANAADVKPVMVAIDKTTGIVYFTAEQIFAPGNTLVFSYVPGGGSPTQVADLGNGQVFALQVNSTLNRIYYVQGDALKSVTLTGGSPTVLVASGVADFAVDGDADLVDPTLVSFNPADNAVDVPVNPSAWMSFSEEMQLATATGTAAETSIRIYRAADDGVEINIPRTSPYIEISAGGQVDINPAALTQLDANTAYYVQIGSKMFTDLSGNAYPGILSTDKTSWNFTTMTGVTVNKPTAAFCGAGSVVMPDIVITESKAGNIVSGTNSLFLGFTTSNSSFKPGVGSVTFTTGKDIANASVTVTANQVTVTLYVSTTTQIDKITISGLEIVTTDPDAAEDVVRSGGTAIIAGLKTNGIVASLTPQLALSAPTVSYPSNNNHYCQGSTVSGTVASVVGTNTQWYGDAALSNHILTLDGKTSITAADLSVALNSPATYSAYVTQTPGACESAPAQVDIIIDPATTTSAAGGDQEKCASSVPLAGNTPGANETGKWSIVSGVGGSFVNDASATSVFNGTAGNTYVLRWTISKATCSSTQDDVTIKLVASPSTSVAGNAQDICGTTATLAATVPTVGTGKWTITDGTGGSITDDTNAGSAFTGVAGNSYTLTWTTSNGVCPVSTNDVDVNFFATPTPSAAGSPQTVCATSVTLDANAAATGLGEWTVETGAGGVFNQLHDAKTSFQGVAGTSYLLRWTISNGPCTPSSSTVSINMVAEPTIPDAGPAQQPCGTTTTLAGNTPTIGTGVWSITNGAGGMLATPASPTSGFTGSLGVSYTLQWTITNPGCPPASKTVDVIFIEPPTTAKAGVDLSVCGTSATLAGNTATSGTGTWSIVSGQGGGFANTSSPTSGFQGTEGASYVLRWTITKSGCTPTSDDVSVLMNPVPSGTGTLVGLSSICPGITSSFQVNGIINAARYEWQLPTGFELVSQTDNTAEIKAVSGSGGTLSVKGVNDCASSNAATLNVTILPAPPVTVNLPIDAVVTDELVFSFNSTAAIKSPGWSFGDNSTSMDSRPTHAYADPGDYEISISVSDGIGCAGQTVQTLHVSPDAELTAHSIKNVVTANGDDQNDVLYIDRIERFPNSEVIVLDRWGVEVFRRTNYANDWDFRKGEDYMPAGNYVCLVKYQGKIYSRSITVLKAK